MSCYARLRPVCAPVFGALPMVPGSHRQGISVLKPGSSVFRPALIVLALITLPLLFITPLPASLTAQTHTSLFGWEEQTQHMILNQHHNFGGADYDRGLFRFITPAMNPEHDLDLVTYDFSLADNYQWYYRPETGFRTFAGSFDLGRFLHETNIKSNIPLTENLTFPLTMVRRHDMRQDRILVWLALNYRIHGRHNIGLRQSLNEQKPDVSAMFYYRYGDWQSGAIQASFTFVDWPNNAVYGLGSQRESDYDSSRKYLRIPFLVSFKAATPVWHNMRGEMMGGLLTPSRAKTGPVTRDDRSTLDRQQAFYFGTLAEWAVRHATVALTWQTTHAEFRRTNYTDTFDEAVDTDNAQWQHTLGGFVALRYRNIHLNSRLQHGWNRDRENNIGPRPSPSRPSRFEYTSFDYREERWTMRHRISRQPDQRGFVARLEWSAEYRDMGSDYESSRISEITGKPIRAQDYRWVYYYHIVSANERLTLMLGYRFSERTWLELGISYDIDGDLEHATYEDYRDVKPKRFDGGFGRMVIHW